MSSVFVNLGKDDKVTLMDFVNPYRPSAEKLLAPRAKVKFRWRIVPVVVFGLISLLSFLSCVAALAFYAYAQFTLPAPAEWNAKFGSMLLRGGIIGIIQGRYGENITDGECL